MDLAIKSAWPEARVFSNDVSLFSCVLGGLLSGEPRAFSFTGELAPFESLLAGGSPLRRLAALVVALEVFAAQRLRAEDARVLSEPR